MRRSFLPLLVLLASFVAAPSVWGQVYERPPVDGGYFWASHESVSDEAVVQVWDQFSIPGDGLLFSDFDTVAWTGTYLDFADPTANPVPGVNSDVFGIEIWTDSFGVPGKRIFAELIPIVQITTNSVGLDPFFFPSAGASFNVPRIEFIATLTQVVVLEQDVDYWISIQAFTAGPVNPEFSWLQGFNPADTSLNNSLQFIEAPTFPRQSFLRPGHRAFRLEFLTNASGIIPPVGLECLPEGFGWGLPASINTIDIELVGRRSGNVFSVSAPAVDFPGLLPFDSFVETPDVVQFAIRAGFPGSNSIWQTCAVQLGCPTGAALTQTSDPGQSPFALTCTSPVTETAFWRSYPSSQAGGRLLSSLEVMLNCYPGGLPVWEQPDDVPVSVRVYLDPTGQFPDVPFDVAPPGLEVQAPALTKVAEETFEVPPMLLQSFCLSFDNAVYVPPGHDAVVEFYIPDGVAERHQLFMVLAPESTPSYITCPVAFNDGLPQALADHNFDGAIMDLVVNPPVQTVPLAGHTGTQTLQFPGLEIELTTTLPFGDVLVGVNDAPPGLSTSFALATDPPTVWSIDLSGVQQLAPPIGLTFSYNPKLLTEAAQANLANLGMFFETSTGERGFVQGQITPINDCHHQITIETPHASAWVLVVQLDGGPDDTTPPVITLNGNAQVNVECGVDAYLELGATAYDDEDGDVDVAIGGDAVDPDTLGTYVVTFDATDAAGNAATQVTRTVTVQDTLAPVLTLVGDAEVSVECNVDAYSELSAIVFDACDPNVTVVVGGDAVDAATLGAYVVTYTATDSSGNTSQETRTVSVQDTTVPAVTCSVTTTELWSPNHDLESVGLSVDVSDACDANATVSVEVWSDETEVPEVGDGTGKFAPDAKELDAGSLRLRKERRAQEDGRVYLIVVRSTDASGNEGVGSCYVVVPHDQDGGDLAVVVGQAEAAKATVLGTGDVPSGYSQHGVSAEIGNKQ